MTCRDFLNSVIRAAWTKPFVLILGLVPVASLAWEGMNAGLDGKLIELATRSSGDWSLNFLVLTLAITPLRRLFQLPDLVRFRRMLGLFSFFYACLHLISWARIHHMPGIARFNPWNLRVAFLGFVLMIPLALTSTTGWIRLLGGKRWRMLHSAVYLTAIIGVIHYYGLTKSDIQKPIVYASIVMILLLFRLMASARPRKVSTS